MSERPKPEDVAREIARLVMTWADEAYAVADMAPIIRRALHQERTAALREASHSIHMLRLLTADVNDVTERSRYNAAIQEAARLVEAGIEPEPPRRRA